MLRTIATISLLGVMLTFGPAAARYPAHVDRVVDGLYVGDAYAARRLRRGYDVVVYAAAEVQPRQAWDVPLLVRAHLSDVPRPSKKMLAEAVRAARVAYLRWAAGGRVLVTCGQGLNRSGLVAGLMLRMSGRSGAEAVRMLRAARGRMALDRRAFERFVREFKP